MTRGRTLLGSTLLLAAMLALVALASRGNLGPDSGTGSLRLSVSPGAFAYVYTAMLGVGALSLPFFFYIYVRETPSSRARRRRGWLTPFFLVGAVGLALAVPELSEALARLQLWNDGRDTLPSRDVQPPAPEWLPLALGSVVVATGAGALAMWRSGRRRRRGGLAETLSAVVGDTLDDLRAEPDARRAIIIAYARMEAALEHSGVPRQVSEAPLEYLARVLIELAVGAAPVHALTELFERAKFSHHAIDDRMKSEAIDALEAIRHDLGGQE